MMLKVCIAADAGQRLELEQKRTNNNVAINWVSDTAGLINCGADLLIDCTFSGQKIFNTQVPLIIHSPAVTLAELELHDNVARFCAWKSFLQRDIWEIAVNGNDKWLKEVMDTLGWSYLTVKDEPGLVSPRILAGIINEAYYALSEGISSKEEIDLAMRLGTNYPYGPFEWAEKIGSVQIHNLLKRLSKINNFYNPVMNV